MAIVDPFERLDLHVIALIVEQLNPVDIIRLQRVSRNWNFILASEYIARVALLAHFPHSPEAVELIERNTKGKVKDDGECVKDEPVKRRRKNKVDILSERKPATEVLGFRRATFRLHTRALAKPCKVHKYRLHHISEKSFAATSTHLFWAESNRNIWVQTIGEGVGGRRSLRLRSFGDTIAHLYQIAATEAGLVIVLFREVATWSLVLMAIEHRTDKIIWKINPAAVPIGSLGLQLTSRHIYYTCTVGVPNTNPASIPNLRNMHVYIHSLETGKLIHTTPLQLPVISDCSVAPGSYIVYPPAEPTKIFATYHVQAHNNNGACRFVVRVYSIDGTILNKFDLHRPAVDITRYRPEMPLRFTIIPGTRSRPQEKIMLVELTSRPYLFPQQPYTWWDGLQANSPVLSSWVINPVTNEVEEIRRYFSTYADNEKTPTLEYTRDELIGGEYTRLECLDAVSGISYIYYDENKKKEPLINGDEDQSLNGIQPVRAWYESGGARIDSMCYEERSSNEGDTGIPMKQEHCTEVFPSIPPRHEGLHYNLSFNSVHASTQTPLDWPYLSYPQPTNPSAVDSQIIKSADTTSKPVVREFIQTSRHKLVQPDIMRRRRRQNLGEDEEDWQLLPVKTQPMIFMDFKNGNATLNDGRFVFLLAKCAGWSITCFVLDFQPEW